MVRFIWDAVRLGLVVFGAYAAAVEPMVLGSWWNAHITSVLLFVIVTWNVMSANIDVPRAVRASLGMLGLVALVTGSLTWRPVLVVLVAGVAWASVRHLGPMLRRVRIHLEEERV